MSKLTNYSGKGIIRMLLLISGAILIPLVFIVDWVGISKPGFGMLQKILFVTGISSLGLSLWLYKKNVTDDKVLELFGLFRKFMHEKSQDIKFALTLFIIGDIVGTLYTFIIQSNKIGTFYASTAIVNLPLRLYLGPFNPYGFLFGVTIALFYGIFRLGMGRILSIVFSFALMASSNHLYNLIPSLLRDYAKAPFILAVLFIMGLLVKSSLQKTKLLVLSVLAGLIIGIGVWIRQDLIVFIPAFVALLFFFIPGSLLANIRIKISALIIFILVFLLYASPKFDQIGYYSAHRTLSGFMTPFDARLGVTRPVYDWGYQYSDDFVWANTYAQAKAIVPAYNFSYSANEYNRLGLDYIWKIATYFPADMLTRTYAAVLKILELPFTYIEPPVGITNQFIIDLYAWRAKIMNLLAGSGFFLVVITLLLVSTVSLRKAIFCLFFLLYFAGYPVLHFQGRHYFHLEFISWWSLGFVLQQTMLFINRIAHRDVVGYLSQLKPSSAKRMLCFAAGSLMILLIPLFLLRQYQSWKVGNLLHAYANADTERLPLREQPLRNNIVLMTNPEQFKPALQGSVSADYLVAEFCNQHCDYSTVWPILRYGDDSVSGRPSFSRSMRINLANFDTMSRRVFFPAISYNEASCGSAYFKGIEMSREQVDCLCGLYRVKDPSQFPLLLTMSLPVTAGDNNLYQMLAAEKTNGIYTIPANMSDTLVKELLRHPLSSLTPDEIVFKADNVYLKANQWVIKGYARSQPDPYNQPALDRTQSLVARTLFVEQSVGIVDTDLLRTKDIRLKKGNYFVAQGRLYVGGFTLGLMKNGQSAGFVNITDRGLFTVIIEVPADGLYSLGLANNLDGYTSLENRFVITKAGWVGY